MNSKQFNQIKKLAVRPSGWNVMRDNIVLALDQAETGPQDSKGTELLASYLRDALRIAHARVEELRN